MKTARQAIRSQAAARDYAERQLGHAEATVQDLRTKLHHAHREKAAAVEAARLATAARIAAQRSFMEAETALATEKAARERADRALREAQAAIRDLHGRLEDAVRGFETAKADLAAERQARQKAEDAQREATLTAQAVAAPVKQDEAVIAKVRRPVGRPRKAVATAPVETSRKPDAKAVVCSEISAAGPAGTPQTKARKQPAAGQEPVQWWVEGWNRRKP
jgi:chromosome segregation ATPase